MAEGKAAGGGSNAKQAMLLLAKQYAGKSCHDRSSMVDSAPGSAAGLGLASMGAVSKLAPAFAAWLKIKTRRVLLFLLLAISASAGGPLEALFLARNRRRAR